MPPSNKSGCRGGSYSSLDVREVEPDLYSTEARTFRADGRGNSGAKMAGRPDVPREFRKYRANLFDLFDGGLIDLFLRGTSGLPAIFAPELPRPSARKV